jgi:hypothetical protein
MKIYRLCSFNGYVTSGSYFVYRGKKYGEFTEVEFTDEFYKENIKPVNMTAAEILGHGYAKTRNFVSVGTKNGKEVYFFRNHQQSWTSEEYFDFIPDRDIKEIIRPTYYMKPKELIKLRLKNGTWFNYVWKQTLIYVLCLLISPVFKQWYLIWTTGLYLYLRLCYIELSKGEVWVEW